MSARRVYNQSQNCYWKRNQAEKAVENCAAEWLEYNVMIRDLTLRESIAKRHQQVQQRAPLPFAELPQCVFRLADQGAVIRSRICAYEANQFAQLQSA